MPQATTEDYLRGHDTCGLQRGDKVRIFAMCAPFSGGWGANWARFMDAHVGSETVIITDSRELGFYTDIGYYFPWFVLEKVPDEQPREELSSGDEEDFFLPV